MKVLKPNLLFAESAIKKGTDGITRFWETLIVNFGMKMVANHIVVIVAVFIAISTSGHEMGEYEGF